MAQSKKRKAEDVEHFQERGYGRQTGPDCEGGSEGVVEQRSRWSWYLRRGDLTADERQTGRVWRT